MWIFSHLSVIISQNNPVSKMLTVLERGIQVPPFVLCKFSYLGELGQTYGVENGIELIEISTPHSYSTSEAYLLLGLKKWAQVPLLSSSDVEWRCTNCCWTFLLLLTHRKRRCFTVDKSKSTNESTQTRI